MSSSDPMRCGFTLLEVLAAVAILGLVYTVLATAGARGIRTEADSLRRLEASMVADRTLTELEDQWSSGTVPQVSTREFESDGYAVRVRISDFELTLPEEPEDSPPGLLRPGGAGSGRTSPLRAVEVAVFWQDGDTERSTVRRSFAFDAASAAGAAAARGGNAQ